MRKFLTLAFIALICGPFGSVRAAAFECKDNADACKTQFANEFQKKFRVIYINSSRDLLNTFIKTARAILAELPEGDSFRKPIEDTIVHVNGCLEKINHNIDDENKITKAIKEALSLMMFKKPDGPSSPAMKEAMLKHDMRKDLTDVMMRMADEVTNLWSEMYASLREVDIKTYPEYNMITDALRAFRTDKDLDSKAKHFVAALEILGVKFDLPFFEAFIGGIDEKN